MTATECLEGICSLVLSAEGVNLAVSGARLPTVNIVAYTVGIMRVPGGAITPLLANVCMDRLPCAWQTRATVRGYPKATTPVPRPERWAPRSRR